MLFLKIDIMKKTIGLVIFLVLMVLMCNTAKAVSIVSSAIIGTTIQGGNDTIVITFDESVTAVDGNWSSNEFASIESPIGVSLSLTNASFVYSGNILTITLDFNTDNAYLKNGNIIAVTPALEAIVDNTSNFLPNNEVQGTTMITGDIIAPMVALTYDPDRTAEYTDFITITATFSESLEESSPCPSITINTEGDGSLSATNMSMVSQTVWTYIWEVPGGIDENGVATIDVNATDLAGNISQVAANNTRNISNSYDVVGPSVIGDLEVYVTTSNTATLIWKAPGDDGDIGVASNYDIRYALSQTEILNWYAAVQVNSEPKPHIAGTNQTVIVTNLDPDATYYFAIRTSDEASNISPLSNIVDGTTLKPLDEIAPNIVTNLIVSNVTTNSATLSWIAPGDDEDIGTATSYDIRYLSSPSIASNWYAAIQIGNEPQPQIAGANQSVTVSGLDANAIYYFAMKTYDEVENVSAISNIVNGTTLELVDTITPDQIINLKVSRVTSSSAILIWTETGDDYDIGSATSYDVRYSTKSINETTWSSSNKLYRSISPHIDGANQTVTVTGLDSDTTYYFAIKVSDEAENVSELSNIARGTTLEQLDRIAPEKVREFNVKTQSATSNIAIATWVNPANKDFSNVLLVRNDDDYPQSIGDGTVIYKGKGNIFKDTTTEEGRVYYYNIYSFDNADNYSLPAQKVLFSNNTLVKKRYEDKIYVVINNEKRWIPTPGVFNRSGYKWENIYEFYDNIIDTIGNGDYIEDEEEIKLVKSANSPRVYLIKGYRKLWIKTMNAFVGSGYEWKGIVDMDINEIMAHNDIRLIKEENDHRIYYVHSESGMKRLIPNMVVFLSYPSGKWEDIEIVSRAIADSYENINLIRRFDDCNVYLLEDRVKRRIMSQEVFNARGFDWNKIAEINNTEFSYYKTGQSIY